MKPPAPGEAAVVGPMADGNRSVNLVAANVTFIR
jgi:hypothetical protein